jgi:hypothetical protein
MEAAMTLKRWTAFDYQLMKTIENVKSLRKSDFLQHRDDWLDAMTYAMHFGTSEEMFRAQCQAAWEADLEGRPFTPVFWTGEAGAEPVLTLWRTT